MIGIKEIQQQVERITSLESVAPYGPEYQLWDSAVQSLLAAHFGDNAARLFKQQESPVILMDDVDWKKQYIGDLGRKKVVLEGVLANPGLYRIQQKPLKKDSVTARDKRGLLSKFGGFVAAVIVVVVGGLILHYFFGVG